MLPLMKWLCALLLLASAMTGFAQTNTVTIDDLMQTAQQWANENVDPNVLAALQNTDQEKVRQFFASVQKNFQGDYVIDMAQLRSTAQTVLPLLENYQETAPYAAWLKTRMDYLDVADELRLRIPPPKAATNSAPTLSRGLRYHPPPGEIREIWIRKMAERSVPDEAKPYVGKLKPIFAGKKVPSQLVWLAEVESSFDPEARSPAGAAGLFQLMPQTARQYGLRTWPFDQQPGSIPSRAPASPPPCSAGFTTSSKIGGSPSPPTTPARARCKIY